MADVPLKGMKRNPVNMPYAVDAFISCVLWASSNPEAVERFNQETGYDLHSVLVSSGIDSLIDETTGRRSETICAFFDWVVVNLWGEAE